MTSLYSIKNFIEKIAEDMANVLEIESSIVDQNLVRFAGTAKRWVPEVVDTGAIQKIITNGKVHMIHNPRSDHYCEGCTVKSQCQETASIHCPIIIDSQAIGTISLISLNTRQREKLIGKHELLISFLQGMSWLISLLLEANKNVNYQELIIDQLMNTKHNSSMVLNVMNRIKYVNNGTLKMLSSTKGEIINQYITDVLPNFKLGSSIYSLGNLTNNKVVINQKNYEINPTILKDNDNTFGAILNFEDIDGSCTHRISKVSQSNKFTFDSILGQSQQITDAKNLARKVAGRKVNILLLGESGTGKEVFARAIHHSSDRYDQHFIAVNCAAIPESLLESELFGYEAGAFTGASRSGKQGKFEIANKGTLLLDEIADMPLLLQAKMLRVLQEKTIERVGGLEQRNVDVRIIAATNKDLDKLVSEGKFREDLYYRLCVVPIQIPPLRERLEDIDILSAYFLSKYSIELGVPIKKLSEKVLRIFNVYDWPGNIRELENVIQYLMSVSDEEIIDVDILPAKILSKSKIDTIYSAKNNGIEILSLEEIERRAILQAIRLYGESEVGKLKAAKALGIGRTTLYRKLAQYEDIGQAFDEYKI